MSWNRYRKVLSAAASVVIAWLAIAPPAAAQSGPEPIIAAFLEKLTGESGHVLTTTGSAYILPGQGLQVNENGTNLLTNPGFESGMEAWAGIGNSIISPSSDSAYLGSGSLRIAGDTSAYGAVTSLSTGGVAVSDIVPGAPYTFSAYVRSAYGTVDEITLMLSGNYSEPAFSAPLQATSEWQRISVTTILGPDDTGIEASVTRAATGAAADIYIDAAQLERKIWLTPYFDGDSPGSRWEGEPYRSRSLRAGGTARLQTGGGIDYNQPFWFAMETTLGFNRTDAFGSYPIGSKDFLNIGKPDGYGTGMLNNRGMVLDYYSINSHLNFSKLGNKGGVTYITPPFHQGDEMQVVCAYDPSVGMDMWVRIGANPVAHRYVRSAVARTSPGIPSDADIYISDSGAWEVYGDYHSNSLHRNFIAVQGFISTGQAEDYLENPESFLQSCGTRPQLALFKSATRWASFADYQNRLLTVEYEIGLHNPGVVRNVNHVGTIDTGGVVLVSTEPQQFETVGISGPGSGGSFTAQYLIPPDVTVFRSSLYFSAEDSCGNIYHYPGPYPM